MLLATPVKARVREERAGDWVAFSGWDGGKPCIMVLSFNSAREDEP